MVGSKMELPTITTHKDNNMNYRELKVGEIKLVNDERKDGATWMPLAWVDGHTTLALDEVGTYRRPLPNPTFEESANFDVVPSVSHEPVDDYEISQHSADEVIYATDTKADGFESTPDQAEMLADVKCFLECNDLEASTRLYEAVVAWHESRLRQLECEKEDRQVAIDEALEVFTGMISPSETQLGVLYDAGYLLPKKDD